MSKPKITIGAWRNEMDDTLIKLGWSPYAKMRFESPHIATSFHKKPRWHVTGYSSPLLWIEYIIISRSNVQIKFASQGWGQQSTPAIYKTNIRTRPNNPDLVSWLLNAEEVT